MKIKRFTELTAWQKARELTLLVYRLTDSFPKEEKYGITSQLRRAVTAIGANIAQGFGRATTPEFLQSLRIARGELEEVRHFLITSTDLGFMNTEKLRAAEDLCDSIGRLINALGKSLKLRLQNPDRTPLKP